jgi:aspartyl-tRNA synthetase
VEKYLQDQQKKSWSYDELMPMFGLRSKVFANMPIDTSSSDMTWVNEPPEKYYDDSELCWLSRHHFFAHQKDKMIGLTDENHPEKVINDKKTEESKFQEIAHVTCISR